MNEEPDSSLGLKRFGNYIQMKNDGINATLKVKINPKVEIKPKIERKVKPETMTSTASTDQGYAYIGTPPEMTSSASFPGTATQDRVDRLESLMTAVLTRLAMQTPSQHP